MDHKIDVQMSFKDIGRRGSAITIEVRGIPKGKIKDKKIGHLLIGKGTLGWKKVGGGSGEIAWGDLFDLLADKDD